MLIRLDFRKHDVCNIFARIVHLVKTTSAPNQSRIQNLNFLDIGWLSAIKIFHKDVHYRICFPDFRFSESFQITDFM